MKFKKCYDQVRVLLFVIFQATIISWRKMKSAVSAGKIIWGKFYWYITYRSKYMTRYEQSVVI